MSKVYFTTLESEFAKELSAIYAKEGFEVVTEPGSGIEYFIDTTDAYVEGDDKKVGEGISMAAAAEAYRKNVCEPLAKLEAVIPWMTGKSASPLSTAASPPSACLRRPRALVTICPRRPST